MSDPVNRTVRSDAGTVLLLTFGIFVLDLLTPVQWVVWPLYFLPLVLSMQSTRERDSLYVAAVATALIFAGTMPIREPIDVPAVFVDRALGASVMWALVWMMVRQKQRDPRLIEAQSARSQAEVYREAAVAARELAEASATGAIHRESQATRELLMSNSRLESILASAMDAIITADEQQQVLLFNAAAERMFGCSAHEAIGQSLDRFIPSRFREAHRRHVRGFGQSGVTNRKMGALGTVTGLRADGGEFPVEAAISHISIEGKTFYTAILRDITERRHAEEALRQSESRLRSTMDNMLEGCQIIGADWKYLYLNEAASRHGRRPRAQLLGRTMMEVYSGLEHMPIFDVLRQCMEERTCRTLESEFTFPDGSKALFDVSIQPVPEGLLILTYDITDRRQAERLIRQSEERYRRLIAVSPYAILVNRDGRVIFANDQALRLFGAVQSKEVLEKPIAGLFHPEYRDVVWKWNHELLAGSQLVPVKDEKIVKLDGTEVDVEVSAAGFTDEEGPAILMMLRDISERKHLQQQLRRTERIAELGTLASGMAHEIGTPMNVILGRAEYLLERVTDEAVKKGLRTIVVQIERIAKVMNQLLSFARRKAPERIPILMKDVVETSLEMFQERLAESRIRTEKEFDMPCPTVWADPDQISQVLVNLIANAVHAMPDGGVLRIGLAPKKDMVKLTVADTGHGIPHEAIGKIFNPFFTTKEFGKGTGLGLTVVKGIIEEHQGSITATSEPGKGSTFEILLPVHPGSDHGSS